MGHPAEHYTKFVMAGSWGRGEACDVNDLNRSLALLGLPSLTESQFNNLWAQFTPPEDFDFDDRSHEETAEFMESHKLLTIWQGDEELGRVIREIIVERPQLQFKVNLLLLGRLPSGVIADKLSDRFSMFPPMTERMIDLYKHYFWKVDHAGYAEWAETLKGSPYYDHYMASLYNGEQQAMWRAGFSPKVDVKKALKDAQRQIFFRLKALESQPDTKAVLDQVVKLTRELRYLYATLYAEGEGLPEKLRELRVFLMKHDIPDVRELEDLVDKSRGGGFSGDGATLPESREPLQ